MKAPCCIVCKRWKNEAGGKFIQFKVVDSNEIEYNKQFSKIGEVPIGHPFGNNYFCDDHLGMGFQYKHLTWDEAEPLIKAAFENNEFPKPPVRIKVLHGIFKIIDRLFSKR